MSRSPGNHHRATAGFTLVEAMVAMTVFLLGSLALATVLTATTNMHLVARGSTDVARAARDKLDELMKADLATDPAVQLTPAGSDSLGNNVAGYFDADPQTAITRRWRVDPGPTAATRTVTIRAIGGEGSMFERSVDLASVLRTW